MPTLKERAPLTTQEILQEAAIRKNAWGIPEGALLRITGGSPPGTEELAGTTSLPRTPNTNTGPPTGTSMALTLATLLADSTAQTTSNPYLPPPTSMLWQIFPLQPGPPQSWCSGSPPLEDQRLAKLDNSAPPPPPLALLGHPLQASWPPFCW